MKINLKIMSGPFTNKNFSFSQYEKISFGRSPLSYISLPNDKKISRYHCVLEILPPGNCFLKDFGSRNGTFIGRGNPSQGISFERIDSVHLQNGDYVKVGDTVFCVSWEKLEVKQCSRCHAVIAPEQYGRGDASVYEGQPVCNNCKGNNELICGKKIGVFEIISKLGEGGMGIVYKVKQVNTGHLFAIKIARPDAVVEQSQVDKFLREANSGASVKHVNIVRHYQARYHQSGFFYIPMEYVEGIDLEQYMRQLPAPLTINQAQGLILPVLDAVIYLHSCDIVHRDIKPANILLHRQENILTPKLTDFGLAKNYQEAGLSGLTMSNQAMGTPNYLAPEQCINARDIDPRADIYSLGATLYKILTKNIIYDHTNPSNIFVKIISLPPIHIQQACPQVPGEVAEIVMKCLEKEPEKRYQSVEELKQAFIYYYS